MLIQQNIEQLQKIDEKVNTEKSKANNHSYNEIIKKRSVNNEMINNTQDMLKRKQQELTEIEKHGWFVFDMHLFIYFNLVCLFILSTHLTVCLLS